MRNHVETPTTKVPFGFSLVELLTTLAIGGLVSLGVATTLGMIAKDQARALQIMAIDGFRQMILMNLGHSGSWRNTFIAPINQGVPAQMNCLKGTSDCVPSAAPPSVGNRFTLYDSRRGGEIVYNSIDQANGLTPKGTLCNNFVVSPNPGVEFNGNDDCPFRFEMQWYAFCEATVNCDNPTVMVSALLQYNPSAGSKPLAINLANYSINNFYINQSPCAATTLVIQPGGPGTIVVPEYNVMVVEAWGGGGGGAAPGMILNAPGIDGGSSQFFTLTAPGGAGGAAGLASGSFVFGCIGRSCWIPFFMGSGIQMGGNAQEPGPTIFPPSISQCGNGITPDGNDGISMAGIGGLNSSRGFRNPQSTGTAPGGGGAGVVAVNGFVGKGWGFGPLYSLGGLGGQYRRATLVNGGGGPSPGTSITARAGTGGAGGLGVSILLPAPGAYATSGYPGGDGIIRITIR